MRTWISDQLIKLSGASDPTVIDFVVATASSSKSSGQLHDKLAGFLDGSSADIRRFSDDLFARAGKPPPASGVGAAPAAAGGKAAGAKPARKKYALLDMEEDMPPPPPPPPAAEKSEKRKERKRERSRDRGDKKDRDGGHRAKKLRRRDVDDIEGRWGDEDYFEEEEQFEEPSPKRARTDDGSASPRPAEEEEEIDEAERDRREREEFEKRLREKDDKSSKKVVEDRTGAKDAARRRALADDAQAREAALGDLRLRSRQEYLKKRETEQLALLRKQVAEEAEEERRAAPGELSQVELDEFARNRETLRLAEERQRVDEHIDGYALPEDYITEKGKISRKKKEEALYKRYVDRDEYGRERFVTEQEEWEREQTAKAKAQILRPERVNEGDYEYVFDDTQKINFVMDQALPGQRKGTAEQQAFEKQITAAEAKAKSIEETRKSLPIYSWKDQLMTAIGEYQCVVVVAETGSGKTTQIPQFLHESGYTSKEENGKTKKMVACTQPRRVAAMSVAARVAEEMGVKLGKEVGYSIRFEDNTDPKNTIVKFMTDGMLLREFLTDPGLENYSAIILDEAHERTLATDILFGLLKDVARARPDLKLIISSATVDAQKFSEYFDDAPIFNVPGRRFPPEANYLAAAVTTVFQIHMSQPRGDILVFLTGQDEIEKMAEDLAETSRKLGSAAPELLICPIYANLPQEEQAKIFEPTPPKARKVTSLTIDGIVYENVYNPRTGMESRASANQRAGRAGRVGPGHCFRLYTKWAFYNELDPNTTPEIQRTNLSSTVLLLKSLGINDLVSFDFMDAPPADTLIRSLELLYALGALNDKGSLTKRGRQMAEFPVDPMADQLHIMAMLGESSALFFRPKQQKIHADSARARFTVKEGGDHLTLLNIWNHYVWAKENFLQQKSLSRARDVRDQLARLCDRVEVTITSCGAGELVPIMKSITAGFFPNAARLQRGGDSYRTVKNGMTTYIHPSSVLTKTGDSPQRFVCYYELVLTSKEYMRNVMPITDPTWLHEVAPHYHKKKDLESLGTDKKMPKGQGAAGSKL
ncbi:uncharacterized protein K452DRAFT_323318 [Aplosporella prunicola CBS 121167]|uniref:RNA helicase n=1 Tax=Aplosporella prunicola CBS 121167 TaxID=1176127 RepID=A0A6A6BSP9_9PEZI|nr:uncharacterized protein K452DRAFT_323318 [Aplosporella prunicola CBS 121167]KAF2147116.1 hypothetical protein K452DRAFT_323318 [Aplosporella prunicola CBS 121167]